MFTHERREGIVSLATLYLSEVGEDPTAYDLRRCVDAIIERRLSRGMSSRTIAAAVAVICQMAAMNRAVHTGRLLSTPSSWEPDFHGHLDHLASEAAKRLGGKKRNILRIHNGLVPVAARA